MHVEAADDVLARELAAEQQRRDPRADDRDRQRDRVGDAQTRARQLVVEQRVAGEPVEDGEDQQRHADHPVDLARPAERAGEEHAAQVHDDGGEEQQRRPVVDLAHHQPGPHVEAQVERRPVGLGHLDAAQRRVAPVVHDLAVALASKKNVRNTPVSEQHDEAVQRELADHERPVVGEHLVERGAGELGGAEAVVEPAGHAAAQHGAIHRLPAAVPEAGPDRVARSHRWRRGSRRRRRRAAAAAATARRGRTPGRAPSRTSNVDWWHGHSSRASSAWYRPTGQPTWVHSFE